MEEIQRKIGIIGFGNQAKAWALNLSDSGFEVTVYLRKNSINFDIVNKLNLNSVNIDEVSTIANENYFALLIPDSEQLKFLKTYENKFQKNTTFIFAHGYSITATNLKEELKNFNYLLLAPKSIASEMREQYKNQGFLGAVYSTEFSKNSHHDQQFLKQLAKGLGITSGPFESTFKEETYADLFSEQSLLCGTIPYLAKECFDLLISKGVSKEVAYFECWYELKLIVDTMVKIGPDKFFDLISPNAMIGSELGKNLILNSHFKENLEKLWNDIESGQFFNHINTVDAKSTKSQISKFWSNQKLSQVHEGLKQELF